MRIIISPAKKMNADTDTLPWRDLPVFFPQTQQLLDRLRGMSSEELQKLWKCNDQIAALNAQRLRDMDLHRNLTPAIIAYEGIQYQYMAPDVFTQKEYDYVQEHLRILSGFYGVLRPMDGVTPYRLEMQAKLRMGDAKDLYAFWGEALARSVLDAADYVINLASKEYSVCISKYLPKDKRMITCVFGEEKDGKIVEKGTMCKMARGEMVRFMAVNGIENPEDIKAFEGLDYRYDETYSDAQTYVFVRRKKENLPEFE
ncbi:MAG: peroxide stress protein YaaA [Clostridia bacterium]|nr:peroxide stress protein YaaA [Clostridia bacterium]